MERLLVTGVDWPIGCNLARALTQWCEVTGAWHDVAVELPGISTRAGNTSDSKSLRQLVSDCQPGWIVHCGSLACGSWEGATRAYRWEREPATVATLVELAAEYGARLTIVSSDVVFCGPRLFHDESSAAAHGSARAVATRLMERAAEGSGALVVRTHAYGWSPVEAHACFAERAFESLSRGVSLGSDGRRYATPILATDLADLLWRAYAVRLQGVHHLTGAERSSMFRFVAELAMAAGLPLPAAAAEATDDNAQQSPVEETSLSSKRGRRLLEMPTPLLREGLQRFVEQRAVGWGSDMLNASFAASLQHAAA